MDDETSAGLIGITYDDAKRAWRARVAGLTHERHFLGRFRDRQTAIRVHDRASWLLRGDSAKTNMPLYVAAEDSKCPIKAEALQRVMQDKQAADERQQRQGAAFKPRPQAASPRVCGNTEGPGGLAGLRDMAAASAAVVASAAAAARANSAAASAAATCSVISRLTTDSSPVSPGPGLRPQQECSPQAAITAGASTAVMQHSFLLSSSGGVSAGMLLQPQGSAVMPTVTAGYSCEGVLEALSADVARMQQSQCRQPAAHSMPPHMQPQAATGAGQSPAQHSPASHTLREVHCPQQQALLLRPRQEGLSKVVVVLVKDMLSGQEDCHSYAVPDSVPHLLQGLLRPYSGPAQGAAEQQHQQQVQLQHQQQVQLQHQQQLQPAVVAAGSAMSPAAAASRQLPAGAAQPLSAGRPVPPVLDWQGLLDGTAATGNAATGARLLPQPCQPQQGSAAAAAAPAGALTWAQPLAPDAHASQGSAIPPAAAGMPVAAVSSMPMAAAGSMPVGVLPHVFDDLSFLNDDSADASTADAAALPGQAAQHAEALPPDLSHLCNMQPQGIAQAAHAGFCEW